MDKKVYEVVKISKEVKFSERKKIKTFCALDQEDMAQESVGKFDTMEEAMEEANKHMPTCRKLNNGAWSYFLVEECLIDIHTEDEEGEFIEGSDYEAAIRYEWNEKAEDIKILQTQIKEAREKAGLTQEQFSHKFEIPIDVVKSWDSGRRCPPKWAEKLLVEKLEQIT